MFAVEVVKKMKEDNQEEVDWSTTEVNVFHPTQQGLFKGLPNVNDTDKVHTWS